MGPKISQKAQRHKTTKPLSALVWLDVASRTDIVVLTVKSNDCVYNLVLTQRPGLFSEWVLLQLTRLVSR